MKHAWKYVGIAIFLIPTPGFAQLKATATASPLATAVPSPLPTVAVPVHSPYPSPSPMPTPPPAQTQPIVITPDGQVSACFIDNTQLLITDLQKQTGVAWFQALGADGYMKCVRDRRNIDFYTLFTTESGKTLSCNITKTTGREVCADVTFLDKPKDLAVNCKEVDGLFSLTALQGANGSSQSYLFLQGGNNTFKGEFDTTIDKLFGLGLTCDMRPGSKEGTLNCVMNDFKLGCKTDFRDFDLFAQYKPSDCVNMALQANTHHVWGSVGIITPYKNGTFSLDLDVPEGAKYPGVKVGYQAKHLRIFFSGDPSGKTCTFGISGTR